MPKVQRTVLIIDDAKEDRMIICRALRQDASVDYHVLEAENGAQALACLRQQQPDCLVLDYQLPDTDGLVLLQTVVQQAAPHIYPVVMLTSASSTALAVQAMQQGAHDFLSKVVLAPEQLQRAVNNATEKVALLRQLEEQREWFRLTLASISDGVIATDVAGYITFMNPVAEALTSWTAGEAHGQPFAQVFRSLAETTRQPVADPLAEVLRTQQIVNQTNHTLLAGRGGRELPIDYSAAPIHDRFGNLGGVVLTFRDVSERKAAEDALRFSEEFNRTVLESSPDCVKVLDAEGRLLLMNRPGLDLMEIDDFIPLYGQPWAMLWPAEYRHQIRDALAAAHRGETGRFQGFCPTAKGTPKWWDVLVAPVRDAAGGLTRFVAVSRDMTESKRAETELHRQEEMLRQITDNVPALIGYMGADEQYRIVNEAFETWFQRPRQQIIGRTARDLFGDEKDAKLLPYRRRALAGETVTYEMLFSYPDGVTRTIRGRYQPDIAADGAVLGFYLFVIDISERKQAEDDARFLADLAEIIRLAEDADRLLATVTDRVGEYLAAGRAFFTQQDQTQDQGFIAYQYSPTLPPVAAHYRLSSYQSPNRPALEAGRTLVGDDAQNDPRTQAVYATLYAPDQERAYIDVPLLHQGQLVATLSVTMPEPRQWQAHEIRLLETIAERTWLAVEKLRLNAELRASEDRFRTLANAMPQLVWTADAQGAVDYYNVRIDDYDPAVRLATGGFDWSRFVHPDDLAPTLAAWQAANERGEPYTFEHRLHMADNSWRWHLSLAMPMHQDDHQVKWYGTATDIHKRKQMEEALRANEAQLNAILYNIPASVYMLTTDHRYLMVNRVYEQENNITNAEIHGQSVYDRWPAAIADVLAANERQVLATKAPVEIEETVQRDGETLYYATVKAPLLDEAGEPYAIIGISTDISTRKRAEKALAAREAFLRAITDAVPNLIGYIDRNRRYRFVNATYAQWFARPREQIEGRTMEALLGEHVDTWRRHWQRALAGETVNFEETFTYPDGVTRTVMGTYIPDRDTDGQVLGFYLCINDITARKQAEAAVAAREAELRVITDNIPSLISYVDSEQCYRFVNAVYEQWYNLSRDQIIGQPLHMAQSKAVYAQVQPYVARALQGEFVQFEAALPYPSGTRTVWGTYVPNVDDQGVVHGFYASITDVSERKRAEEQVRASEARFRQLANAMPQIVWACQADGALTYVNDQWPAYSGMNLAQTLEQGMWPALHPDDQAANRAQWQYALESGQAYEAELRLRRADGEYRWHLERAVPIRNDAGVIEQWFGASVDIDDHKRAQEALAQINERFVLAEHASNGWVYDFNVQPWTVERSSGFSRILGYASEEISPDVAWWHSLFHPEDRHLIANQSISARSDNEFAEVEYRVRHRDGYYVHLLDRSRNIHNAAGQRVRVVGITVDISERKAAEQALQQFNVQLDQQVKERTTELTKRLLELDQFAYIASHDLKAPLRAIDHLAHWISDDTADLLPPTSRGHLEKMRGRIVRMEKLLDGLLAYSRADRYEYRTEKVDIAILLDDVIRLVTPPQGFAVSVQTPLPGLITQKVPLETVLRNLINNAIKHHDRSDGEVQVRVQDLGEFIEFSVRDDGPGIASEFHERIFQVFQTLKPRDEVEGSGMGLAIVKKIVESRNGHITITSAPGQGATFQFTWPKG